MDSSSSKRTGKRAQRDATPHVGGEAPAPAGDTPGAAKRRRTSAARKGPQKPRDGPKVRRSQKETIKKYISTRLPMISGADTIGRAWLKSRGVRVRTTMTGINPHGVSAAVRQIAFIMAMSFWMSNHPGMENEKLLVADAFGEGRFSSYSHLRTEEEPYEVRVFDVEPWKGWARRGVEPVIEKYDEEPHYMYMCDVYHGGPGDRPLTPEVVRGLADMTQSKQVFIYAKMFHDVGGGFVAETDVGQRLEGHYVASGSGYDRRVTYFSDEQANVPSYAAHPTINWLDAPSGHMAGLRVYKIHAPGGRLADAGLYMCSPCECDGVCQFPVVFPEGVIRETQVLPEGWLLRVLTPHLPRFLRALPVHHSWAVHSDISCKVARGYNVQRTRGEISKFVRDSPIFSALCRKAASVEVVRDIIEGTTLFAVFGRRSENLRLGYYRSLFAGCESMLVSALAPAASMRNAVMTILMWTMITPLFKWVLGAWWVRLVDCWYGMMARFGWLNEDRYHLDLFRDAYLNARIPPLEGVFHLPVGASLPATNLSYVPAPGDGSDEAYSRVHRLLTAQVGDRPVTSVSELMRGAGAEASPSDADGLFPLLLLASPLFKPAATNKALVRTVLLRVLAPKLAKPGVLMSGERAYESALFDEALARLLRPLVLEDRLTPEGYVARALRAGNWAKHRAVRALQAIRNNDHGIGGRRTVELMLKRNELLPLKEKAGRFYLKERPVGVVDPAFNSILSGPVKAASDALKKTFNGGWAIELDGITFYCVYAAGLNQRQMNSLGELLQSSLSAPNTITLAACGDDMIAAYCIAGASGVREFDAKAFDAHHSSSLVKAMRPLYETLLGHHAAAIWEEMMGADASYRKGAHKRTTKMRLCMDKGTSNPSGIQTTTIHNTLVSLLVGMCAFVEAKRANAARRGVPVNYGETLDAAYEAFGFAGTGSTHVGLVGATFLRGWWFPTASAANPWAWVPLPSAVLKLGKTFSRDAPRVLMGSIAGGYAGVPEWYPFLGPLVTRYKTLAGASPKGIGAAVESAEYKVFVRDKAAIDRATVMLAVEERYGLAEEAANRFASLVAKAVPPCMICDTEISDGLFIADYA